MRVYIKRMTISNEHSHAPKVYYRSWKYPQFYEIAAFFETSSWGLGLSIARDSNLRPTGLLPVFVNKSGIGTQPHSFIYILSTAAFVLQQQNWVAGTETVWPTESKIFGIWPFTDKVCQPLLSMNLELQMRGGIITRTVIPRHWEDATIVKINGISFYCLFTKRHLESIHLIWDTWYRLSTGG